ncbi:gamma-glutamylcyclotransferase [Nitratireductor sp. ac15]
MDDFWVFGYGSLMWRPGFAHVETCKARLYGYRRALCIYSHVHRGTPDRPGLVLGLDRGGSCLGLAFRVPGELEGEVIGYLRERELVTNVYLERRVGIRLANGTSVTALTYVVDRRHGQYAGSLDIDHAVQQVRASIGQSGPNVDYVHNTVEHLKALDIRDYWLEAVAARLDETASLL